MNYNKNLQPLSLQPLQGLDVPRLLAHGDTYEGYAYAVKEQVQF